MIPQAKEVDVIAVDIAVPEDEKALRARAKLAGDWIEPPAILADAQIGRIQSNRLASCVLLSYFRSFSLSSVVC